MTHVILDILCGMDGLTSNKLFKVLPMQLRSPLQLGFVIILSKPFYSFGFSSKGEIWLDGLKVDSLQTAFLKANDSSVIRLGAGDFQRAGTLTTNNVSIVGQPNTRLHSKSLRGKAAIVVEGDNTLIKNIECFDIRVSAKNGACIRLQESNLTLVNVYFHVSEQGLLTGSTPGEVLITNSRFERLGKSGRALGIYVGGGTLIIKNTRFLSAKDQGHEIKSRASVTQIERSVIASLNGEDSRLVDVPNGGRLIIKDSVLAKGPKSKNANLIGLGQEGVKHTKSSVTLIGNIFLLEKPKGNKVLNIKHSNTNVLVTQNAFIGRMGRDNFDDSNFYFEDRKSAGLGAYSELPNLTN